MPSSAVGPKGSNPPRQPHWLAEDDECGTFASGPREHVKEQVGQHFVTVHPDILLITEGVHFRMYEAPWRCDICGIPTEPPFWTHTSSRRIELPGFVDCDGEWNVCQECHVLLLDRNPRKLAIRMVRMHQEHSPGLMKGEAGVQLRVSFAHAATMYVALMDDGVMEERYV